MPLALCEQHGEKHVCMDQVANWVCFWWESYLTHSI